MKQVGKAAVRVSAGHAATEDSPFQVSTVDVIGQFCTNTMATFRRRCTTTPDC